jgi:hypothetical protein
MELQVRIWAARPRRRAAKARAKIRAASTAAAQLVARAKREAHKADKACSRAGG